MNGIWVRSEDGRRLVLTTEFAVSTTLEPAKRARFILYSVTCGDELATYKTQAAAIRQLDDIQASLGKVLQPHVYDLRERKAEEE